ncbi:hypothetical protein PVNG_05016 [Plasmodium vivax North Korean]|uniref:Variable surface protein Vir7-like protein n=1 Tax=Plasmodium vivax North Korean TaxID=1035514 RepID=A0A0J9U0L4_PLAVI|nr:hypothetical protein PVNG_05016 [Plasmodium vivax North Korean]
MFNYLGDKQLGFLRTKFYYNQLDNGRNVCQNASFYNLAKNELNKNDGLQDVSDKILKALCYVHEKSFTETSVNDICDFLYFWLGNILLDKMKNNHVFHDVIRNLFDILINDKKKICTAPTYYINVKSFKDIKLFFDYSQDYDSYIGQLHAHNPPCNNNYKEYLQKYVDTYNKFQRECQDKRPYYSYCDVFDEYFAKKKAKYLSNWTCKLEHNEPKEIEESDDSEATEEQLPKTYRMEERTANFRGGFEGGREQNAEHTGSSNFLQEQDTFVNNSDSDNSNGTPPSIISKSVTGAVSVAGALVPSYLLYNVISIMFNKYNAL